MVVKVDSSARLDKAVQPILPVTTTNVFNAAGRTAVAMTDDLIEDVKAELEGGGNWPYAPDGHEFTSNPFAEQWPDPRLFAGYDEELHRVRENVQRNVNTFVTGPFGTGKTILTRTMYEVLDDVEGFEPVFVRVQKGRFAKTMAKRILRELGQPVDSSASQNRLYEDVAETLQALHRDGTTAVIFYDEIINGSEGTLRQVLHLQRDVDNWEPVLVFNGTAHMLDQIHAKIEPLSDRIGEEIHLSGLDVDGAVDLVNKRLRYYCEHGEWGDGDGCAHDDGALAPFTREAVELVHQDVTPYPRHLRRECNAVVEAAAREDRDVVDFDFAKSVMDESAGRKLEGLSDPALSALEVLDAEGPATANGVTEALDESAYAVQEALGDLEKEGLVRASEAGRGIEYGLTDQAERELANRRAS
jgi:type II secretory pathway predicted ATPase ExeA/DNA-binding transcriptional ArsR family regulator